MNNNFFYILSIDFVFMYSLKIAFIILALVYFLYSLVFSKNVKLMTKILETKFNRLIIFISSFQMIISLILLFFAIFLV